MQNPVEIKGKQNYLEIRLDDQADFNTVRQMMIDKLAAGGNFFIGSPCVQIIGLLNEQEKNILQEILEKQFSFEEVLFQEQATRLKLARELTKNEEKQHKEKIDPIVIEKKEQFATLLCQESASLFINNTVRNGQRIEYDGHIIVRGDVNRGGELVATGNIIVLGALRGRAHAGSAGDTKAYVSALELVPQQLRIAQALAIAPEGDIAATVPEIASVFQNAIVIAPMIKKKKKKKPFWK